MKSKLYLLASVAIFFCISCSKDSKHNNEAYIAGQIANPSSKYVIIAKNDVDLDTLYLNQNNQFLGTLKNVEAGLYTFKHPPENQTMFLEPGDSTLVWLNTLAFDESLNFSGKGSEKSNFLTNIYLLNQQNNDLVLSCYTLEPKDFAKKTDSIRNSRLVELDKLKNKINLSSDFFELASNSIDYEYYDLRERYSLLMRKYQKNFVDKIPDDFHSYRADVDFNDVKLQESYVYLNFIDDFLRTKSIEFCKKEGIKDPSCYNLTSEQNIARRILLTDSLIKNEKIKEPILLRLAGQGIVYSENKEEISSILKLLEDINYKGNSLSDLKQMGMIQSTLLPGNNIGCLKLVGIKNDSVTLKEVSNKPKITYNWSISSQGHYKWQQKIIEDLRNKYPEVSFIGVNIDKDQTDSWKKVIEKNSFDPQFEFKLEKIRVKEDLLKIYLNKLIFLDPSGRIVKRNIQMNSPDLETQILEFISE